MNPPKNKQMEADFSPIFDPFPETRTMPDGWDLSGHQLDIEKAGLASLTLAEAERTGA